MPMISVVMSVYNGEKYLKESIESVLNQSYIDFEFIIINDGSKDNSLNIINSYNDERIKLINNEENKGLIYSLNKGIEKAIGKYILRFDADDICLKDRFKIQVEFMEENEDVYMMSGFAKWFVDGKDIITKTIKTPSSYEEIKAGLIFENHINHSCVIMKRELFSKYNYKYDSRYLHIEDYGLWLEIAEKFKVKTLDKILIKCRISKTSVTSTANKDMREREKIYHIIYDKIYSLLGYIPTELDYKIHFEISMIQNLNMSLFPINEKINYCNRLIESNNERFIGNILLEKQCVKQLYKNALHTGELKEFKEYIKNYNTILEKNNILVDTIRIKSKKIIKKIIR